MCDALCVLFISIKILQPVCERMYNITNQFHSEMHINPHFIM